MHQERSDTSSSRRATVRRRVTAEIRRIPVARRLHFATLRRTSPVSRRFGYDRGMPVDRHYIEGFLERHAADVRGSVLEIGDSEYTRRFGGSKVSRSEVLDVSTGNPRATIVDDLAKPRSLRVAAFDCIICTQTLHLIYDVEAAVRTLRRSLAPDGVLLATLPGITSLDARTAPWYWFVSRHAAARLFGDVFGSDEVEVEGHGNVLSAIAFLHGLAAHELDLQELSVRDPCYDLIVAVRAARPAARSNITGGDGVERLSGG